MYSYQDVAEAMVVHELRLRGVPLRRIKRVIELLREEYGDWQLTQAPIVTAQTTDTAGKRGAAAA